MLSELCPFSLHCRLEKVCVAAGLAVLAGTLEVRAAGGVRREPRVGVHAPLPGAGRQEDVSHDGGEVKVTQCGTCILSRVPDQASAVLPVQASRVPAWTPCLCNLGSLLPFSMGPLSQSQTGAVSRVWALDPDQSSQNNSIQPSWRAPSKIPVEAVGSVLTP